MRLLDASLILACVSDTSVILWDMDYLQMRCCLQAA
jgi:hypothetical protein